jgi:hypothetical protein
MPRHRPRKIVTWRYDDHAGTTLDIPVYQVTDHQGIRLRVDIAELDIREENSDISLLRERVYSTVKGRGFLKWEPFLQVSVSSSSWDLENFVEATQVNPTLSFEISVQVARIEIGTRPDGSQCYRMPGQDSRILEWPGEEGDGVDDDQQRDIRSRIAATPENRQAMVDLGRAFFRLGRELGERLRPERVEQTVAQLIAENTLAGLPARPRESHKAMKGGSPSPSRRNR